VTERGTVIISINHLLIGPLVEPDFLNIHPMAWFDTWTLDYQFFRSRRCSLGNQKSQKPTPRGGGSERKPRGGGKSGSGGSVVSE
jgi:hypothetical protein